MRFLITIIIVFASCNKQRKVFDTFKNAIDRQKSVVIYKLKFENSSKGSSKFSEGYLVEDSIFIDEEDYNKLRSAFFDPANYSYSNSKGCVLVAKYGLKIVNSNSNYTVFIGADPCTKLMILENVNKGEFVVDLIEKNTIIPTIESSFKK
jgi:hypothetical protein